MLNWYLQNGKDSDVVVSSRIRIARNIAEFPFEKKCDAKTKEKLTKKMEEITPSIGYGLKFLRLKDMDEITQMSLVEKRLISPDLVREENQQGAILLNEDENICVMLQEEDHLRIQVFAAGMELPSLLHLAMEIEEKIGNLLNYAYHEKYGFLTACPSNVGTGMRASVMLHLPGLTQTGNIGKILEIVNNFGMNVRGIYGEGSKSAGDMYQISNKQSIGITEEDIIKNLQIIVDKVMEQERLARKYLGKDRVELEDKVYRIYGMFSNARKMSSEEARTMLSEIKLGTDLGVIKELDDLKVKKLDLYTKPANLQKYFGKPYDVQERDIKRAELIKQIIAEN